MKNKIVIFLMLAVFSVINLCAQVAVDTAGLQLANVFTQLNTFQAGIAIGGVSILPGGGNYALTLPATAPGANAVLQNSTTPGMLQWGANCGGFMANGDLGGNSSSQIVVGINGIPIDTTVTPTDGMTLKYNAAANKWVPSL